MSSDCLVYTEQNPELDRTMFKFDCGFAYVIDNMHWYKMNEPVGDLVLAAHKEACPLAKKKNNFGQDNYYKNTQEEYGTAPKFPPGKPAPINASNFFIGPGTGIMGDHLEGWKSVGYTTEDNAKAIDDNISSWAKIKKSKLGHSNWHEDDHGDHVTYIHHTSGGSAKYISGGEAYYTPAYDRGRPPIDQMPGLRARVKHPVQGHDWYTLEQVIISLNDQYRWSRERIADWLDTLDIDLSFKTETSV